MLTSSFFLIIIVCLLVSSYGSLIGFGGGVFIVPILVAFFDYSLKTAVGSVMLALIPSSLLSTYYNGLSGNTNYKMGILLELPTMVGTVLGSLLLAYLPVKALEFVFGVILIFLGFTFLLPKRGKRNTEKDVMTQLNKIPPVFIIKNRKHYIAARVSLWLAILFGGFSGIIAGLFGVGGGFLKTPIMVKVFKIPAKIAASTALFMIVITSTTGTISHYLLGHVYFHESLPVVIGFVAGAYVGKHIHTNISPQTLEKAIGLGLIAAALIMILNMAIQQTAL